MQFFKWCLFYYYVQIFKIKNKSHINSMYQIRSVLVCPACMHGELWTSSRPVIVRQLKTNKLAMFAKL